MTSAPGSGITVDAALLVGRDQSMDVYVRTPFVAAATRALTAAVPRLFLVTMDGTEYEDSTALEAEVLRTGGQAWECQSANHIDDVVATDDGAYLLMDTHGAVTDEMSRTVVRVVTEELTRAGVGLATLRRVARSDAR